MSDSSTESPKEENALQAAQEEQEKARVIADAETIRRQEAEAMRDTALNVAVSQAAHRDVAELVARNEAYIRHATEQAMLNAKIRANQAQSMARQTHDENGELRENLVAERKAASNATFGLAMVSILLLVGLIAGGIWFFSQNNANASTSAGTAPGVVASAASTPKASDVSPPSRTPAAINSSATLTETSGTKPAVGHNAAASGSAAGSPSHTGTVAETGNISGAVLGSIAPDSSGEAETGSEESSTVPVVDSGTLLDNKAGNP